MLQRPAVIAVAVRRSRTLIASFSAVIAAFAAIVTALYFSGATAEATSFTLTSTTPTTNWSDILRWNGGTGSSYPGQSAGDVVTIGLGGTTINIDVAIPNPVQLNISGFIPVTIPSTGSLTLAASSSATSSNTFTVNGGTLGVGSGVTLSSWQGPITMNSGTFNIGSGALLGFSNGSSFTFNGGTISGGGTLKIPSGHFASFTGSGGAMTLSNVTFDNFGTTTYNSSTNALAVSSGAQLIVESGGAFNYSTSQPVNSDGLSSPVIGNLGTINVSSGSSPTINCALNNGGAVNLLDSSSPQTLTLAGGGTDVGAWVTAHGSSVLQFSGGTHNLNSGTGIAAAQILNVTGGTVALNTSLTAGTLNLSGGTLSGPSTLTATTLNWTGGTISGSSGTGGVTISTTGNINGAATTLTNAGQLQNSGTVHYQPSAAMAVNTGGTINNYGTWQFENGTGMTSDLALYNGTQAPQFFNWGTISKALAGSTTVGAPFTNAGPINLSAGADLEVGGGATFNAGTLTFASSSDIFGIPSGFASVPNASTFAVSGPGTFRLNGTGFLSDSKGLTIPNLEVDSGSGIAEAAAMSVTTALKSTGAVINGGGSISLGAGATGDLTALASSFSMNNVTFNNSGTINYSPAFPLAFNGNGIFNNLSGATLNITGAGGTSTSGSGNSFTNAGTINRSGAATFFTFDLPFTNSGTVSSTAANDYLAFSAGGSMSAGAMQGTVASAGIEFSGGTFNVTGGGFGTAGGVKVVGGTLNINANTNAPAGFALSSGTLGGTATLTLPSGSTGNIGGGTVLNTTLTAASGSTLVLDTTSTSVNVDGSTININSGATANWNGANQLLLSNAAVINDGGTFNWTGGGNVATAGATPSINVTGTLNKTTSASTTGVAANLQNSGGTISAQAGALQLNYTGSSNHSGTFNTSSGAEIDFGGNGGNATFTNVTNSGTGLMRFMGGTDTFATNTTLANLELDQATLNGPSSILTYTGTFDWKGGTLNVPTNSSAGTLNILGTLGNMVLGGNLSTTGTTFSSSNSLTINSGVTLHSSGTFTLSGNGAITGSTGTFTNIGTVTRAVAGSNTIDTNFNNTGTLNLNAGTLTLGPGLDAGTYTSATGTTLTFGSGNRSLLSTSSIGTAFNGNVQFNGGTVTGSGLFTPTGPVTINGGTFTYNNTLDATFNQFSFLSGALNGSGPLVFNGSTTWSGGTISGNGTLTNNATLTIAPTASSPVLLGRSLQNTFNITLAAGATMPLEMDNGASINNQSGSTVDMQNDAGIITASGTSTFTNSGALKKTAGSGVQPFSPALTNALNLTAFSGTLQFLTTFTQSGGSTTLSGGTLSAPASAMLFSGGTLAGSGTIDASVTNSGASITPGTATVPGTINLTGAYSQTAGTLNARLAGTGVANYDRLIAAGAATLTGGTLNVSFLNSFTPSSGDTFDILGYTSQSGDFATKTLPTYGSGGTLIPAYTPSALQLTATLVQTDLQTTMSGPSTILHNNNGVVTITVTNLSSNAASGVSVADYGSGTTVGWSALTPSQGTCTAGVGGTVFTCNLGTLNGHASATISFTILGLTVGTFSNNAIATTSTFDANTANNDSSNTTPYTASVVPGSDIALTITDLTDPVISGGTVTYIASVANHGFDPSGPVPISLNLSGGTITSVQPGVLTCGLATATSVTCTANGLAFSGGPGPSVVVVATAGTGATMQLSGVATYANDPNQSNNSAVQSTAVIPSADLSVTQSGPPSILDGQNDVISITVTNGGSVAANNVTVTDTFAGAGFVSATPSVGTCSAVSGGTFTCSLGTLNATSSATITLTLSANAIGNVTNQATVSSSTPDPSTANNNATYSAPSLASSDVSIAITGAPAIVPISGAGTFTVTIGNAGPDASPSLPVSLTLTGGTIASITGGAGCGTLTATTASCTAPALNAGAQSTFTVTVTAGTGAAVQLSGTITSAQDPNTANNAASSTISTTTSADLSITKSGPSSAVAGSIITYAITVANAGPSNAANVVVSDTAPARLQFLGFVVPGCTTFPCTLGTVNSGASVALQVRYRVIAGPPVSITNTAGVTSSTSDPNTGNNSASASTQLTCSNQVPQITSPAGAQIPTSGTISWSNAGFASYNVYFGKAGTACSAQPAATVTGTSFTFSNLDPNTDYEVRIEGVGNGCPNVSTSCITLHSGVNCAIQPQPVSPASGTVSSPVLFTWTAVPGATQYEVFSVIGGVNASLGTTASTSLSGSLPDGSSIGWFVVATVPGCGSVAGPTVTLSVCNDASAPLVSAVAQAASGQTYSLQWPAVAGASRYEIDESTTAQFTVVSTQSVTATSVSYLHTASGAPQPYFYRVRAFGSCKQQFGSYSQTARVVVAPPARTIEQNVNVNVPAGSITPVTVDVFVPGQPGGTFNFFATGDQPWITVTPSSGVLGPDGVTLHASANPSDLPNGTFTATVLLTLTPLTVNNGHVVTTATSTVSVPVSVSLVTPISPIAATSSANALIIPSVGHLDGLDSHWQSDIRVANTSSVTQKYSLTFNPSDNSGTKQTTISIDPGVTTALDDIVRNWYGVGALGEAANGVLSIVPQTSNLPGQQLATVASSRTYNVAANGTLGQFIPAIPFGSFIGAATKGVPSILSLQQIAQSAQYRTNFGVVEGSGQPATVLLSVFDASGTKLKDITVGVKPFEQLQLNSMLATNGITTLNDGRVEAKVVGGTGKVTAYASVVDNSTQDPLLVSGVPLGATTSKDYVLPGVADLNSPFASWRTDMRVFNSSSAPQVATLTFYPLGNAGSPQTTTLSINPGEVKTIDNTLQTLFGSSAANLGGAIHVSTLNDSSLVVTARTFNQTESGTYGQFIPAVTPADAVANGGRTLQILQVEDSPRYRTNLGIAEVSGKPATVEVTITLPDSRVSPRVEIPLAANEYRQEAILSSLGLGNVYNARIAVRVISGEGKVAAYGSVIDRQTQDPTYVPAQ